jgi:hypothetical protein
MTRPLTLLRPGTRVRIKRDCGFGMTEAVTPRCKLFSAPSVSANRERGSARRDGSSALFGAAPRSRGDGREHQTRPIDPGNRSVAT